MFLLVAGNTTAQAPLTNELDSVSYLIGQAIAGNVLRDMSEANKDLVMQGLGDGLYKKQSMCSDPNNVILNSYFQEKNRIKAEQAEKENLIYKVEGEKFLEKNKTKHIAESEFQFQGFMKIIAFLMPGQFKKQTGIYLKDFKAFAEKQN